MDNTWEAVKTTYEPLIQKIAPGAILTRFGEHPCPSSKGHKGEYLLRLGEGAIAKFSLEPLPFCRGVCLSGEVEVQPAWRGKGLGTLLNRLRADIAKLYGYSVLMCTHVEGNEAEQRVLEKNGWKTTHQFLNRRTGRAVKMSVLDL